MKKTFVAAISLLTMLTACGQLSIPVEHPSHSQTLTYATRPVFATAGKEFTMSSDCSHYSTQITLRVKTDHLDLVLSTIRSRDTMILNLDTKFIHRVVETSEGSTQTRHQEIRPAARGGNDEEYQAAIAAMKGHVTKLIDGNRCTPRREELKEVADYLDSIS